MQRLAMSATQIPSELLALQRLYHWERSAPERVVLTQPMGGGVVRDFTWRQLMDQTRRMASHLLSQGIAPGDRVAILSKNTAWWLMADFAVWMAGGVSVPLYPTLAASTVRQILQHSESKLLFVGKLDGWDAMKAGVPADLPCIALPLAPPTVYPAWDDLVARSSPLPGEPVRDGDELATIMYTSGTTGTPKGVMHSFATFAWSVRAGLSRVSAINEHARMLSYLPLSHVAERTLVEHGVLSTGLHIFFAESLDTFATDLQRARPTAFFSVPRLWVKFQQGVHAKMPPEKLQRLLRLPIIGRIVRKKVLSAIGLQDCEFAAGGAAPDAAGAAALVRAPRAEHRRGLRHDRELRRLARHAAGCAAPWHRGAPVHRSAVAARPEQWRNPGQEPRADARLLQRARAHARGLHRRWLAAHWRQGRARRRWQPTHHRAR
jgi:long-chain acyl-CoA synthetase